MISRISSTDKEFSFQNWFADRLKSLKLSFDDPSRNAYPDFRLVDEPIGFEIKGLGFPGREANYDCNRQVPSGDCIMAEQSIMCLAATPWPRWTKHTRFLIS